MDIQIIAGPPQNRGVSDTEPGAEAPSDLEVVFWAMQVSFVDDDGGCVGGGHFGLQWFHRAATTHFGAVNWGVYDDIQPQVATFRGSVPEHPSFTDIGVPPTWGFELSYGDWHRFRCVRSPRQNWQGPELDTGDGQPVHRVGIDQCTDEIAFRVTVENLTKGTPPVAFRDVLVRDAARERPLSDPVLWTETDDLVLARGPVARFANIVWDGRLVERVHVGYAPGTSPTNSYVDDDGALVQAGASARTTPKGTELRLGRPGQ